MLEKAQLLIDAKATLGEGPSWDAVNGCLYWVDILKSKLHVYDPGTKKSQTYAFDQHVCAVAPKTHNEVVLAMQHGFYLFHFDTEDLSFICDPEAKMPENRFNDGKCDPAGRFWAGTMEHTGTQTKGALYRLNTDLSVQKVLSPVRISNGLAWSPNYKTMYYIDTPTQTVVAFDYQLETGSIEQRRVCVKIPEEEGAPDGMTIDERGMLWIAHWGGGKISRWDPDTGIRLGEVFIPCSHVTSCVFGGEQLDELFITTARVGLDDRQLEDEPSAGGVFRIKTDVKGIPTYAFGG